MPSAGPRTSRANVASQPSVVTSPTPPRWPPVPALLNSTSSPPNDDFAAAQVGEPIREALLEHPALLVLQVGADHLRALGQEQLDRPQPDPRRPAGDQGHFS